MINACNCVGQLISSVIKVLDHNQINGLQPTLNLSIAQEWMTSMPNQLPWGYGFEPIQGIA